MPQRALTDRFCATAKPAGGQRQTDYFDEGHPGLALRVSASAKGWSFFFTLAKARRRMSLGTYPATSLAVARTRVDEARAELEAGRDPRDLRAKPQTFRSIAEEWLSREGSRLRTVPDRRAALGRAIYPTLGERLIGDIRRSEIVRLLDEIEDERGPVSADKALELIRRIMNWHAARSDDFSSPIVRGMSRSKPHERARKRILTDDELRTVWRAAEELGPAGRYVRFLLLTGARRAEAAGMRWAELDGADWTLPAARNKTKLDLLRPLSPMALAVIGAQPAGAEFVFSTNHGSTPLAGFSELKIAFDRATGPMERWTLHDLRRTARSLMSRAGVPADYAERVLGHVIGGVRGTYDRYEYQDEKRDALGKLARLVNLIVCRRVISMTLRRMAQGSEANA